MISGALANMGNLNLGMICVGANDRCWCELPLAPVATPHFAPSAMRPLEPLINLKTMLITGCFNPTIVSYPHKRSYGTIGQLQPLTPAKQVGRL